MIKLTRFHSNTNHPAFAEAHGRTFYLNEKLILSVETVFPYTVRTDDDLKLPLVERPREKATLITYAFNCGEEPFNETVQESVEEVLRRVAVGAGGQTVAENAETLKARAASVLCEAGALCGWPAPNCNAREGAEALFKAGLLSQSHPVDERVVEAPRIADPNNLDPIHTRLLTRGAKSKWIWLSDDAGTHTGEVCALGELRRAGLVKYTEDKLPPGPPSMRPMEITEAGRAALSVKEGRS
jgi:hypothetical protein